jgi:metacaspase-1
MMTNKALLCGINDYQSQTDLRGCINDIEEMNRLLLDKFDFAASNIHKLKNEEVTKSKIQNEWQWLLEDAESGDRLVFHFSGHGSYVPDDDGEESDGYDEITCLYDMDFYDSATFFRDDEWNQAIEQVPSGVQLIMIFDTCHSGTGTRMLPVNLQGRSLTMSVALSDRSKSKNKELLRGLKAKNTVPELLNSDQYQEVLAEESVVVYRFLSPPPDLQEKIVKNARSKALSTPGIKTEGHLLLAACQDSQTSADAYLDGDFHGAFTYYFCQAIANSPQLGTKELIEQVTQQLTQGGFSQKPQHEGENLASPIFGKSLITDITNPANLPNPNPKSMSNLNTENQKLLIEAYIKLLDTIAVGEKVEIESQRDITGDRYLVLVHGISKHIAGYSNPWWKALRPHVGQTFGGGNLNDTRKEVIWSDLVNARELNRDVNSVEEAKKTQLRQEIADILEDRQRQEIAASSGGENPTRNIPSVIERGGDFAIDDFLIYMSDSKMRQRIIDRFTQVVEPLLATGSAIDIISHSWGTVVAYEGLRELEQRSTSRRGKVGNFFTVGSALSLPPVRNSLRKENKKGDRPSFVNNWFNLDAKGDLVGGMLQGKFAITQEFLELEPTECDRGILGYGLGCAHGSYFKENNLAVNRDIFARLINKK